MELFKVIPSFPNYKVSDVGTVKSLNYLDARKRMRFSSKMSALPNKRGYLQVGLTKEGKRSTVFIHRLVAETFIRKVEGKDEVNHIDGNKFNNKVSNLEWCSRKENMEHASKTGLLKNRKTASKLKEGQVVEIRKLIDEGVHIPTIAKQYGIHRNSVYLIRDRKTWQHI